MGAAGWAPEVTVSYLLRVLLPDRPGMLGAVATALGAAGADILGVDVVERAAGVAVDDLIVELPPGKLADSLVSAAVSVPGVSVESIQRYYAGAGDAHRELELLDALAAAPSAGRWSRRRRRPRRTCTTSTCRSCRWTGPRCWIPPRAGCRRTGARW